MAIAHAELLSLEELRELIVPIVRSGLDSVEIHDVELEEDEDFDGAPIVRVTATVNGIVDAATLIDVNDLVQVALWKRGDDRFVFLSTLRPGADEIDEDTE